jgi:hypothetical protein
MDAMYKTHRSQNFTQTLHHQVVPCSAQYGGARANESDRLRHGLAEPIYAVAFAP